MAEDNMEIVEPRSRPSQRNGINRKMLGPQDPIAYDAGYKWDPRRGLRRLFRTVSGKYLSTKPHSKLV